MVAILGKSRQQVHIFCTSEFYKYATDHGDIFTSLQQLSKSLELSATKTPKKTDQRPKLQVSQQQEVTKAQTAGKSVTKTQTSNLPEMIKAKPETLSRDGSWRLIPADLNTPKQKVYMHPQIPPPAHPNNAQMEQKRQQEFEAILQKVFPNYTNPDLFIPFYEYSDHLIKCNPTDPDNLLDSENLPPELRDLVYVYMIETSQHTMVEEVPTQAIVTKPTPAPPATWLVNILANSPFTKEEREHFLSRGERLKPLKDVPMDLWADSPCVTQDLTSLQICQNYFFNETSSEIERNPILLEQVIPYISYSKELGQVNLLDTKKMMQFNLSLQKILQAYKTWIYQDKGAVRLSFMKKLPEIGRKGWEDKFRSIVQQL